MEDAPYSIRPIDELKRVFLTLLSYYAWRRARIIIFAGKLEQALTLLTVEIVFLWLVLMLRKKAANVPPLIPEVSTV